MDISTDAAAALTLQKGVSQQVTSLASVKRQAKVDLQVATMAMQSVKPASTDPNRGQTIDTHV